MECKNEGGGGKDDRKKFNRNDSVHILIEEKNVK